EHPIGGGGVLILLLPCCFTQGLRVGDAVVAARTIAADVAVQEITRDRRVLAFRRRAKTTRTRRAHVDERAGGRKEGTLARQFPCSAIGRAEAHHGWRAGLAAL